MNAGADPFEGPGLFVNPDLATLALQQSGGGGAAKSGSDDGNAGPALHVRSCSQSMANCYEWPSDLLL